MVIEIRLSNEEKNRIIEILENFDSRIGGLRKYKCFRKSSENRKVNITFKEIADDGSKPYYNFTAAAHTDVTMKILNGFNCIIPLIKSIVTLMNNLGHDVHEAIGNFNESICEFEEDSKLS